MQSCTNWHVDMHLPPSYPCPASIRKRLLVICDCLSEVVVSSILDGCPLEGVSSDDAVGLVEELLDCLDTQPSDTVGYVIAAAGICHISKQFPEFAMIQQSIFDNSNAYRLILSCFDMVHSSKLLCTCPADPRLQDAVWAVQLLFTLLFQHTPAANYMTETTFAVRLCEWVADICTNTLLPSIVVDGKASPEFAFIEFVVAGLHHWDWNAIEAFWCSVWRNKKCNMRVFGAVMGRCLAFLSNFGEGLDAAMNNDMDNIQACETLLNAVNLVCYSGVHSVNELAAHEVCEVEEAPVRDGPALDISFTQANSGEQHTLVDETWLRIGMSPSDCAIEEELHTLVPNSQCLGSPIFASNASSGMQLTRNAPAHSLHSDCIYRTVSTLYQQLIAAKHSNLCRAQPLRMLAATAVCCHILQGRINTVDDTIDCCSKQLIKRQLMTVLEACEAAPETACVAARVVHGLGILPDIEWCRIWLAGMKEARCCSTVMETVVLTLIGQLLNGSNVVTHGNTIQHAAAGKNAYPSPAGSSADLRSPPCRKSRIGLTPTPSWTTPRVANLRSKSPVQWPLMQLPQMQTYIPTTLPSPVMASPPLVVAKPLSKKRGRGSTPRAPLGSINTNVSTIDMTSLIAEPRPLKKEPKQMKPKVTFGQLSLFRV